MTTEVTDTERDEFLAALGLSKKERHKQEVTVNRAKTMFVANVPSETALEEMAQYFGVPVDCVSFPPSKVTARSMVTYCFIRYPSIDVRDRVLRVLNRKVFKDRVLILQPFDPDKKRIRRQT